MQVTTLAFKFPTLEARPFGAILTYLGKLEKPSTQGVSISSLPSRGIRSSFVILKAESLDFRHGPEQCHGVRNKRTKDLGLGIVRLTTESNLAPFHMWHI
jgi:hypothetical protein